jgi:O-antigen ligase
MFNQTRVPGFGPYLNLSDVCVLIAFVSVFLDQYRSHESPRVPQIVSFMLFALIISTCQSFWRLGWTYETLRSFRWGLEMPIAFLLGSNMIASAQRAKSLTCALFCGAVLAAIQHGVFVMSLWQTKGLSMESYHVARTITFWGGCMASAFLVASVAWPIPRGFGRVLLYVAVRLAFLATLLLNQTRSLWLGTAASIPIVAYLFDRRNWCRSMTRVAVAGLLAVFVLAPVARRFIPGLDIIELINSRVATSLQSDPEARGSATRARAFRIEMQSWMDGTLVFGRGLCFFQAIRNYPEDESRYVAFGHLGYVTYLSQAGLVGLLAYGLCLPLGVVRAGRRMWFHSSESAVRYAGLLGTASIMCVSIMFVTSAHFLSLGYFAPGVLYGAMWRLAGELPEEQCVDHMRRVDGNAA